MSERRVSRAFATRLHLARLVTPPPGFVREIDILRTVGVLWVCLGHSISYGVAHFLPPGDRKVGGYNPVAAIIASGTSAIDGFFCISGFVIASLILREWDARGSVSLFDFYRRRATRLLPVYFLLMAICAVVMLGFGVTTTDEIGPVKNAWFNVIYVNNYVPIDDQYFGWTWSLAVEEQFYLVFPLFFLFFTARRSRLRFVPLALAALILISFAARVPGVIRYGALPYLAKLDPHRDVFQAELYLPTHARFGALVIGIVACLVHRRGRPVVGRGVVLLASLVAFLYVLAPYRVASVHWSRWASAIYLLTWHHLPAITTGLYIVWALGPKGPTGRAGRFLRSRFWHPISQLSYSAYLVNLPVVAAMNALLPATRVTPGFAVLYLAGAFVLTFASALVLWLFVERPAMVLLR